jgi:hypothetical protein
MCRLICAMQRTPTSARRISSASATKWRACSSQSGPVIIRDASARSGGRAVADDQPRGRAPRPALRVRPIALSERFWACACSPPDDARMGISSGHHGQVVESHEAQHAPPHGPRRLQPMRAGISPKTSTIARNTRPLGGASPAMYSKTDSPRIKRALTTSAVSSREMATTPMPSRNTVVRGTVNCQTTQRSSLGAAQARAPASAQEPNLLRRPE